MSARAMIPSWGSDSSGLPRPGPRFVINMSTIQTGALAMILIVLLVLALFVVQTMLPNRFREPAPAGDSGGLAASSLGPRDNPPALTRIGGRAERALANMQEALPVFLALALMNMIVGTAAAQALTGAWIFFIARLLYVPA